MQVTGVKTFLVQPERGKTVLFVKLLMTCLLSL